MTKFDKEYLELCKKILTEGYEVKNRTGINTIKIPGHNFEFDLEKEFPILQSKKFFYKNAIIEMLWIWQMQSNDVRLLHDRGVKIWDEWMIDKDGVYRIYDNNPDEYFEAGRKAVVMDATSASVTDPGNLNFKYDSKGKVMKVKSLIPGKNIIGAKYYGKEFAYTIGTAYGYIVNRYKHTQNLINTLKKNPEDRRMVKSLWQDEFLSTAVLPSCVWSTEWDVTNDKLNLTVHQRSCDVPVGLPFDVTQYATLLSMIAHVTDLVPGKINYTIKDAHIYVNQLDNIKKQIDRWDNYDRLKSLSPGYLRDRFDHLDLLLNSPYPIFDEKEKKKLILERDTIDLIINGCKPELWLNPEVKDFFSFDNSRELKDIKIKKYKHLGELSFKVNQ